MLVYYQIKYCLGCFGTCGRKIGHSANIQLISYWQMVPSHTPVDQTGGQSHREFSKTKYFIRRRWQSTYD